MHEKSPASDVTANPLEEMGHRGKPTEQEPAVGFETFLGKGFTNEYFASMEDLMIPFAKLLDSWNVFLQSEPEEGIRNRTIELDTLTKLGNHLMGLNKAPTLFPVFIDSIKRYYASEGVSDEHVTPERMRRFYDSVRSGASAAP